MWREMAQWQTFTINSAMYGRDRYSQQKLGSTQAVLGFAKLLPSAAACSHLVVSIHLHSLIITKQVSPFFYTPSLFSHYSFGQEGAFTTQLVWPPKK